MQKRYNKTHEMVTHSCWFVWVRAEQQIKYDARKRKRDGVLTEDRTPRLSYTLKLKVT